MSAWIADPFGADTAAKEKDADLPVQASVKFELVTDLKTAKALGVTVAPRALAPPMK